MTAITGGAEAGLRTLYIAEPPARYRAKPPAVVDASLLCALLYGEPEGPDALTRMAAYQLAAPSLLACEVANVAVNKVRRGAEPATMRRALEGFAQMQIESFAVDPALAFALAVRFSLSAYDAAYLALADQIKAPLLTLDQRLAEAAKAHLGNL